MTPAPETHRQDKKNTPINRPPFNERRPGIKHQHQVIYEKIEKLNQVSTPFRDDKLYDSLYEEQGIGRIIVSQQIGTLLENRIIFSPKPGYYAIATPAHYIGTNTKQL